MKRGPAGLALLLLLGCQRREGHVENEPDGAWLYKRSCAGCHGGDARGGTRPGLGVMAPDLTTSKLDESATRRVILEGKQKMPPFAKLLTQAELDAILRQVQGLKNGTAKPR